MAQDRMTFGHSGTATFELCAGGRLVPAVHVCAGKAAEREGFCCAQVDRRLKPLLKLSGQSVWQSLRWRWQRSPVAFLRCMDRCV